MEDESTKIIIKNNEISNWYLTINAAEVNFINDTQRNRAKNILFQMYKAIPSFTGRIKDLLKIHYFLTMNNKFIVCGLGGVGKSELLRVYGWKYKLYYGTNIIWINSETNKHLQKSFLCLAAELNIYTKTETDDRKLEQVVQEIYRYFSGQKVLFIFDNVLSLKDITSFFPIPEEDNKNVHILISSQNTEWNNIDKIVLDVLPEKQACKFINNYLLSNSNSITDNEESVKDLAQLLQYLPLALQQAVAYISNKINYEDNNYNVSAYIEKFKNEELLMDYKFDDENSPFPDYSENIYDKTIFITVKLMLENIENTGSAVMAKDILYIVSYFSSDCISKNIFLPLTENCDNKKLNVAIRVTVKYSLITVRDNYLFIHRLVQKVLRYKVNIEQQEEIILNKSLILVSEDCNNYDTHLISVLGYVQNYEAIYTDFYQNTCKQRKEFLHFVARNNFYIIFKTIIDIKNDERDLETDDLPIAVSFSKNVEMMKLIMEKGFNIHVKNDYGVSAFRTAALEDSTEMIEFLLSQNIDIHQIDQQGHTPLYFAVFNGNVNLVNDLIKRGADVNAEAYILNIAVLFEQFNIAKILIKAEISFYLNKDYLSNIFAELQTDLKFHDKSDTDLLLCLIEMIENGKLNTLNYMMACILPDSKEENIISSNFDVSFNKSALKMFLKHYKNKNNLLQIFATSGRLEVVKMLLDMGVDINHVNNDNCTALYYATLEGQTSVFEYLISKNANINHINNNGDTVLFAAVQGGHMNLVTILVEKKVQLNLKNKFKLSIGCCALFENQLEIFQYLIDSGMKIENIGFGTLYCLIQEQKMDAIKLVIKNGFNVNCSDENGYTLLHFAAMENNFEILNELLENNADINACTVTNETALTLAKKRGNFDMVKYMLEKGAQPNTDAEKLITLYVAIIDNNINLVEHILKQGISPELYNKIYKGNSLFFSSVQKGYFYIFKKLVEYNLECLQEIYGPGYTILHAACYFGHLEIVEYLVSMDMSIEKLTNSEDTPLHLATQMGNIKVVKYLIKKGANVNAKNNVGECPLMVAVAKNQIDIIKILIESKANVNPANQDVDIKNSAL